MPKRSLEFIGRARELRVLSEFLASPPSSVAAVYGRRRIGKTRLIAQALELRRHPSVWFEGLENQSKREQIRNFLFQLSRQTGTDVTNRKVTAWREAFVLLCDALQDRPKCIVLDEFQWMANYRSEIVSDLKMVWDQYLAAIPGMKLIVCGSIASFMIKKFVKSSAFYGRTDLIVHLKGFDLTETREMLGGRGVDETTEAYMCVGGIPKYLELLRGQPSVRLGMDELAFSQDGYFVGEFDRIFTSHFGRSPEYRLIVETLAKCPYGLFRAELAEKAGLDLGGSLSEHLMNLESAGFISSWIPLDKGENSRLIRYHLSDAYLRFYFTFIRPSARKVQSGIQQGIYVKLSQTGRFNAWRGRAFEYLCIDHAGRIAEILGFSGIDFVCGPFFRSPKGGQEGVQIDFVFDRADRVISLCEAKSSLSPRPQ